MISESILQTIRDRIDIVSLVGESVPLRRAGQSHKGLCPFHKEKSPSFHVSQPRQTFHCFGCGAGGDVFHFVMRMEGVSFPEAVRLLAQKAGVEVPDAAPVDRGEERRVRARGERLVALMDQAAGFYQRMLRDDRNSSVARDAVAARGLDAAAIEAFRLGYAPAEWDALASHLREKGVSPADAEELGLLLARRSGGGHYDRFRHRLMFPISDPRGRIVAFSGRALPAPEGAEQFAQGDSGKYINSPETPLYRKGDLLYGLHEGRIELRRTASAILVEGNFDVVSMHRHGFATAVAPLGTALTIAQARLLRRFVDRATLLFDGDAAGAKAVRAAYPILRDAGLAAKVATLPPGMDPDEMLRSRGPEALRGLLDAARGIVEHIIDCTHEEAGADAASRARAIESLGPVLALVDDPVERGLYVQHVAQRFAIRDLKAVRITLTRGARKAAPKRPAQAAPGDEGHAAPETASTDVSVAVPQTEAELVGALLDQPSIFSEAMQIELAELLTSDVLRAIFHAAARMAKETGTVSGPALLSAVSDGPARAWLQGRLTVQKYATPELAKTQLDMVVPRLRQMRIQAGPLRDRQRQRLEAARQGDREQLQRAMAEEKQLFEQAGHSTGPGQGTR